MNRPAADPVLLEPIVKLTIEAKGQTTEVRAEMPMAEVLDLAHDLRSISGGRVEFERYGEVPGHLAEKAVSAAANALSAVSS